MLPMRGVHLPPALPSRLAGSGKEQQVAVKIRSLTKTSRFCALHREVQHNSRTTQKVSVKTPLDIKQAADLIGDHLRAAGHPVPRNVALELSAKLARFRNLYQAQNATPASAFPTGSLLPDRDAAGRPMTRAGQAPAQRRTIFRAVLVDITTMEVDAIVNSTNTQMSASKGVSGAIHRAAGPILLVECLSLGGCAVGEAKITKGHRLPAKHIIHTVSPLWLGGETGEPEVLASCYRSVLEVAEANGVTTLAFPSIGTGINGYPVALAAEVAVATVRASVGMRSTLKEVIFCCYSDADLQAYERALLNVPQPGNRSNLSRFVDAQSGNLGPQFSDYRQALHELQGGRKETHWIWYVFPQLLGLGTSEMSVRYGIESREEARAYLNHPTLGERLRECVNTMKRHKGTDPERIFSPIDAAKFRSCLTLFKAVAGPESVFAEALNDFYQGQEDGLTIELLASLETGARSET